MGLGRFEAGGWYDTVDVTLAVGANLTAEIDLGSLCAIGVKTDGNITATTLTFQGGGVSGALANVYDDYGKELSVTVAASRMVGITQYITLLPCRYLKIRSGTSGSPTNQATNPTTITLMVR